MTLTEAYASCEEIARREAKNFYYSFRVLPVHKRNAICAVYAFMRKADDLADDESISVPERRQQMRQWLESWRAARSGQATEDPVFIALTDAQQRFGITDKLLEELVQGTCMDLNEPCDGSVESGVDVGAGLRGYPTFEGLYRYCYLVASVVGLVCIRIFGYTDARAEELAEQTGIAFQLTNILRDVKEDAERRRLYLPMDMMAEFHVTPESILELAQGRQPLPQERALLHTLSVKAWEYYRASRQLLPLIDADSRPALWVLVAIYSGLLKRVDALQGDVFSRRARVPTAVKLAILAQGAGRALTARVVS
ncbi:MAG TPA: phytoene/squalene synthase family protein [Granulicella sp.]